ncbi:MFS transporter [Ensifer adhaerens]|uniref:MFS transporter n=1 Tax=Ensifer adhaerens TaxID=106592 RepID=UPI001CBDEA11|nr:MFS transporter [Ensifer adhaerens]MBZ7924533.1 MFS transporter [Ensifer adhaerens]UAX96228.1 MFS transporter [Ensifer adhaerens]UAY04429.1 MFS transporter [Ensifer adhaerens]UAY09861.1 MFS transporter [Ensifer adhaerens]
MNPRLFLLALATFATGTAENIVIGILPDVSKGLSVSVGLAGQLTAVFSVVFALSAPAAQLLTVRLERRTIFLSALALFVASNIAAALSLNFEVLFIARIAMAMASATVCLVATMLATELAVPDMRGRAIGVIFMGISGSMVLGVPVGMVVSGLFGWRSVFVALALFALLILIVCYISLKPSGRRPQGASGYWQHLRSLPLLAGQLVSILMIGGHFVLFAYLAPYITGRVGLGQAGLVLAFVAFGVAGVSGGYLGGWLADAATPRRAIVITPFAYLLALLVIPLASPTPWAFTAVMMVWGCISWMISPVVQSFLMTTGPDTAEAGVGLNLSAMHVGVALGTAVGGLTLESLSPQALPSVAAMVAGVAVVVSLLAVRRSGSARHGGRYTPSCSEQTGPGL